MKKTRQIGCQHVSNEGVTELDTLANYRKFALRACKDLLYPETVYDLVKNAKTENEIDWIMNHARNTYLKD